ncbi:hypothetical protein Tco_0287343 [Tanacetum coccineum]
MTNFLPGRAVVDAAQRKRIKYEAKCADIGYGFLPFSFSSFGELEKDAVTLLKQIRKFSVAQEIGACAAVHIFSRIRFAITREVRAQIVSRLPTIFLSGWLDGGLDKPLHQADMLLYSWDKGFDVCVDLARSSPLTQTRMVDFVPGRAVIEAAQRKCVKYESKCIDIGYGFLPLSFSSFRELEKDAVALLNKILKFFMAQDIEARVVHIF